MRGQRSFKNRVDIKGLVIVFYYKYCLGSLKLWGQRVDLGKEDSFLDERKVQNYCSVKRTEKAANKM